MAHIAYQEWFQQYGPMFRIFIGLQPYVVITGELLSPSCIFMRASVAHRAGGAI